MENKFILFFRILHTYNKLSMKIEKVMMTCQNLSELMKCEAQWEVLREH